MSWPKSLLAMVPWVTWTTGRPPSRSAHQLGSGRLGAGGAERAGEVQRGRRVGAGVLEGGHRELHDGLGVPGPVEDRERQAHRRARRGTSRRRCRWTPPEDGAGQHGERAVARAVEPRAGGSPSPYGAVSRLASDSGRTPQTTTGGRSAAGVAEHEGAAGERRVGEHGVGRLGRVRRHDGVVLRARRLGRRCARCRRRAPWPLQVARARGSARGGPRGRRSRRRPGSGTCVGAGGVDASANRAPVMKRTRSPRGDEVPGDGEQRGDVAVDRHAGDDDRGHGRASWHSASCRGFGFDSDRRTIHHYAVTVNWIFAPGTSATIDTGLTGRELRQRQAQQTRLRVVAAAAEAVRRARLRPHHTVQDRRRRRRLVGDGPGAGLQGRA